ncbi:PQQ-dependent sugar dehydrogenase [Brachybacterium kimchii]|uniref:PQQ-dependent sugar dehydrogenase n=1 Tax=Brachybacterium kimchii TaxID=2942909 RepID=A0ABY4N2Q1_9MICO|nr:PQQ-dependent sugar dehydrogenase [Brachybacterium kimchii]UQN28827.1 PQQ-dependent sugar dehydrogenase [Brachybacterium kimchii]
MPGTDHTHHESDDGGGRPTRRTAATLALVTLGGLAACTDTGTSPRGSEAGDRTSDGGGTSTPRTGDVEVLAEGLEAPWSIAFHYEAPLITERDSARLLERKPDGSLRTVATIPGVTPQGEAGLLGIAVRDGALFAHSTSADGNRIQRFEITGDPGSLGLGEATTLLDGIPSAANHNGGRLAFGPDGKLYATAGDAGDRDAAQDVDALAGKILRLEPDGSVPADNPFPDSPVFSFGHRNPQGIAWDEDGTMYASEFGQDTWDELNVIEAGKNYGWPRAEGIAHEDGLVDPRQQWHPADASPSGLAISHGTIHIAALRGERLIDVPLDDLAASTPRLVGAHGRLRDAVIAPDGSLWVLTNNTDGRGSPSDGDDRLLRVSAG